MTTLAMLWFLLTLFVFITQSKPSIDPFEQNALYTLLNSINPTIPWTTLYPRNLCISPPFFLLCDSQSHIVELNFGFTSDQTHPLPCSPNPTLQQLLFTSFTHLRKLSFSNCFQNTDKPIIHSFPPSLQELLFIDNPSFASPLGPFLSNLTTSLRKLVLIGNGFHGQLPQQIGDFHNMIHLSLSENYLSGEIPANIGMLKKLEILDLSHNKFTGCVPHEIGNLIRLSELNLSSNGLECKIPETFLHLKNLVYLDLTFNRFGKKLAAQPPITYMLLDGINQDEVSETPKLKKAKHNNKGWLELLFGYMLGGLETIFGYVLRILVYVIGIVAFQTIVKIVADKYLSNTPITQTQEPAVELPISVQIDL